MKHVVVIDPDTENPVRRYFVRVRDGLSLWSEDIGHAEVFDTLVSANFRYEDICKTIKEQEVRDRVWVMPLKKEDAVSAYDRAMKGI